MLSFPLVGNLSVSLLWKRGVRRVFLENRFFRKIPLDPPLPKGEATYPSTLLTRGGKNSGLAGMT